MRTMRRTRGAIDVFAALTGKRRAGITRLVSDSENVSVPLALAAPAPPIAARCSTAAPLPGDERPLALQATLPRGP